MPDHGISRLKNAPWEPTSKPSTAGDTTDLKTQSLHRWTTACRACWDSGWSSPRTSTTPTNSGWSGRCFPSPFAGRSCCITSESNTFTCPQPHLSKDSRCYRLRKERLFWTWVFLSTAGKKSWSFQRDQASLYLPRHPWVGNCHLFGGHPFPVTSRRPYSINGPAQKPRSRFQCHTSGSVESELIWSLLQIDTSVQELRVQVCLLAWFVHVSLL